MMKLESVYARFFRSLNFDYIRMSSPTYEPDPWDITPSGVHYPFVHLRLEEDITTVVGGNESGKSQMLAAIEAVLTGKGYHRSDFCRYSPFFAVDKTLLKPEFGALFGNVTKEDVAVIEQMCALKDLTNVDQVALFRMNGTPQLRLYLRSEGDWSDPSHVKTPALLRQLGMPVPFKIDAEVPLPDSVPLEYLATGKPKTALGRHLLRNVWDTLATKPGWFTSGASVTKNATEIADAFRKAGEPDESDLAKFALASDLLIKVAGLDQALFVELQTAVKSQNGYANSIVDTINSELAKSLNFPQWWSQDSHFELFVSLYEYDLVFMIRDRTGRSYGFDERSDGLKYFLSYFVQYLAHDAPTDGQPEILLMDEPDRYLSSSGQQDLLRIFGDFSDPEDETKSAVQVMYVTHSPFLIDKNHAERIRVLEKGEHDEGTRVVAKVAQNHYEPLRSAFGSFVGETAFIGTCNLILEGVSDQILLAGISSWMGRRGIPRMERLDLNSLTLVPAGGVSHVPYLTYLARGRDVEQPSVIVLLDGDKPAKDARATIRKGGARKKELVDAYFVMQLSDTDLDPIVTVNPAGRVAIEDLIPLGIAIEAASLYCKEFEPEVDPSMMALDRDVLFGMGNGVSDSAEPPPNNNQPSFNNGMLCELERTIRENSGNPGFQLNKIAFARGVLKVLEQRSVDDSDVGVVESNFRLLFTELGKRQRTAVRQENTERISSRINRARDRFLRAHTGQARKEHVLLLMEEISGQLDNSVEADDVRISMRSWHHKFNLDDDPRGMIENFDELVSALKSLAYTGIRNAASVQP